MTVKVPKVVDEGLKSFAHAVWGNPQAVLKHDDFAGVDYLDLSKYIDAFEFLLGALIDKILVRKEYRIALEMLENERCSEAVYVTGQPGIGKTLFLVYILVTRLGQECPVAWDVSDCRMCYVLFGETATIHSANTIDGERSLRKYGPFWALSDSNAVITQPSSIFGRNWDQHRLRIVQATPPERHRWKSLSKYECAQCYIMDIWKEDEIAALAKLLRLDVGRMSRLAKELGGSPRDLLRSLTLPDEYIKEKYARLAVAAVEKCDTSLCSVSENNFDNSPSSCQCFYFCRPEKHRCFRRFSCPVVPTVNLRRLLAEALPKCSKQDRVDFFRRMGSFTDTWKTAGYIYENWFHTFFSVGKSVECNWLQNHAGVPSLTRTGVTKIIPATNTALEDIQPPYYWITPKSFSGVDSVLVLDEAIYAIQFVQITIYLDSGTSPTEGLQKVRSYLPGYLKDLPWSMIFVGDQKSIRSTAELWSNKVSFPTEMTKVPVGWSAVHPVCVDATYMAFRDESGLDVELPRLATNYNEGLDVEPMRVKGK